MRPHKRENKPILLDIGAVWCHWCHVMDRESYEIRKSAKIVNQNFVAGKGRPRRASRHGQPLPGGDSRHHAGKADGRLRRFSRPTASPFTAGPTSLPRSLRTAEFQARLLTIAEAYREKRDEVCEQADR